MWVLAALAELTKEKPETFKLPWSISLLSLSFPVRGLEQAVGEKRVSEWLLMRMVDSGD